MEARARSVFVGNLSGSDVEKSFFQGRTSARQVITTIARRIAPRHPAEAPLAALPASAAFLHALAPLLRFPGQETEEPHTKPGSVGTANIAERLRSG